MEGGRRGTSIVIWHYGAAPSLDGVDGVSYAVWQVAGAQALAGHDVTVLLSSDPDASATSFASRKGLRLVRLPLNVWARPWLSGLMREGLPHVAHLHSVFNPVLARLAAFLARNGVPYVLTPNGGLAPQVLERGWAKKALYSLVVERPRFGRAAAITIVAAPEEDEVRSFVKGFRAPIRLVPNPVDADSLAGFGWAPASSVPRITFMGRFDVWHKGIDLLVGMARLMPGFRFDLHGREDRRTRGWLRRLRRHLPENVSFNPPVYGKAKAAVLSGSTLYLQPSRWEAFGISTAEAMYLGVPCALMATQNLAPSFAEGNLGVILPLDVGQAARELSAALRCPARLKTWSERGQAYARERFHPSRVAAAYADLYEVVLKQRSLRATASVGTGG